MTKYTFYFDESFHDPKITFHNKIGLNFRVENALDSYIGLFWGCKDDRISYIASKLETFEKNQRRYINLPETKELKSTTLDKKNFKYGLSSFNEITLRFYTDLFKLVDEIKPILQVNIISKTEFFVRKIFPGIENHAIIYTLTKFIVTYGTEKLFTLLKDAQDLRTKEVFRQELIRVLKIILKEIEHIPRKDAEYCAYAEILGILVDYGLDISVQQQYKFGYFPNFDGLMLLLDELSINSCDVSIIIDFEEETRNCANAYPFGKIISADSRSTVQVRLADWLCGFIGRIMFAISHDSSMCEDPIVNIEDIPNNDLISKRLLDPKWFEIDENRFNLYCLICKTMIDQQNNRWSYLTCDYFDQTALFTSLIQHIASYDSYEEYISIDPFMHSEYVNICCCSLMNECFNKFGQ